MGYKFMLYPTEEQENKMLFVLEECRWLYNRCLSILDEKWEKGEKIPSSFEMSKLVHILREKERPQLSEVYSTVLYRVLFMLYSNLKALHKLKKNGKKVGRLRYKKEGRLKSFIYHWNGFKIIETGKRLSKLCLSKIGEIPIRIYRKIEGKIKQVIVKRYPSGKWYTIFYVEREDNTSIMNTEEVKKVIGLDMGVKHFLTDSEGRKIENPRWYERVLDRLRIECKRLSMKVKGSKNWEKQRKRVAKLYERLVNQRDDFLHKLSRFYINNYDVICIEDLNIKGMVRSKWIGQKILDASWGKFFQLLSYKAERAGKRVVKVDPRGTSNEYRYGEFDRDYNASLNILERGLKILGMGLPCKPVETGPLLVEIPASLVYEAGTLFLSGREKPLY